MLCSVSAGKSGSSWLDRLRSSKGFPSDNTADLEHFLNNPVPSDPAEPDQNSPTREPRDDPIPDQAQNGSGDSEFLNLMSNVLAEIFNFGDARNDFPKVKKSCRKQSNPRICVLSSAEENNSNENNNEHSEKASRKSESGVGCSEDLNSCKMVGVKESGKHLARENEGSNVNLVGFSRTEVTVIDTSCKVWKFDKLLFRRKNVWKVRDKKGKSVSVENKKKRKAIASAAAEDDNGSQEKKRTLEDREKHLEAHEFPSQENDKLEEDCGRASNPGKDHKKRRADLLLDNGSSSVILIKSIPTSKKNGTHTSRGHLKPKQNVV